MLSIGRLSAGQVKYYLDLAREDYYLNGGEPPGRWWGKGAEALGLTGQVGREEFERVYAGYSPAGEPLVQNAGNRTGKRAHRPGFDLVFSAPKSLSILWSQSDEKTRRVIEQAHFAAVCEALGYVQDEAGVVRRGRGGKERVPAGLVVATFEHGTSRSLDPLLHTHCLVMNAGVTADGRSGAIAARAIYERKMATGALYRADLIDRSRPLGLEWEPYRGWFEVKGVPRALIDELSKRRAEIQKYLAEHGLSGAAASAIATLATRKPKDFSVPRKALFHAWREVGRRHQFDPGAILHRSRSPDARPSSAVQQAIAQLTESRDHFSGPQVIQHAAQTAAPQSGGAQRLREAVQDELNRSDRVVRVGSWGGFVRYTTWELLNSLNQTVESVALLMRRPHGVSNREIEKRIKALTSERSPAMEELRHHLRQFVRAARRQRTLKVSRERLTAAAGITLAPKHAEMVRHLTRKGRGSVRCVESERGPRHLLMLRAVREAYESAGYRVIGLSPSRRGVAELKKGAGIVEAKTLRGLAAWMRPTLKYRLKHHAKQIIKVAIGEKTRRLRPFAMNRKTVLIFDDAAWLGTRTFQKLVAAAKRDGGLLIFTGFPRATRLERPTLFEALARRLRSTLPARRVPERREPGLTLLELARRGLLIVSADREAAREKLVADWNRNEAYRLDRAVIACSSDDETKAVNRCCQAHRLTSQWLDSKGRLKIDGSYAYAGDAVVFTKRSASLGVRQGETGRVLAVKSDPGLCVVRLGSGGTVVVPVREYPHVRLAYALTPPTSNEQTAQRAFVLGVAAAEGMHLSGETRVYVHRDEISPELRVAAQRAQEQERVRAERASRPPPEPEMAYHR